MYINFILSIEATFVNITFQSSKQEDLNDTLYIGSLKSRTLKPIKFKVHFGKSEAFLTDPTNIARK